MSPGEADKDRPRSNGGNMMMHVPRDDPRRASADAALQSITMMSKSYDDMYVCLSYSRVMISNIY